MDMSTSKSPFCGHVHMYMKYIYIKILFQVQSNLQIINERTYQVFLPKHFNNHKLEKTCLESGMSVWTCLHFCSPTCGQVHILSVDMSLKRKVFHLCFKLCFFCGVMSNTCGFIVHTCGVVVYDIWCSYP